MAYQTKDNSGSLFKNGRKETDNHPDYQGQAVIDGVEYWMSAWVKVADSGRKYFSFSFKPKEQKQRQEQRPAPKPKTGFDDMDSDVPF